MTSLLESPEYTHQDRLGFGSILAPIAVDVLSYDDRWSNLAFRMIIV